MNRRVYLGKISYFLLQQLRGGNLLSADPFPTLKCSGLWMLLLTCCNAEVILDFVCIFDPYIYSMNQSFPQWNLGPTFLFKFYLILQNVQVQVMLTCLLPSSPPPSPNPVPLPDPPRMISYWVKSKFLRLKFRSSTNASNLSFQFGFLFFLKRNELLVLIHLITVLPILSLLIFFSVP